MTATRRKASPERAARQATARWLGWHGCAACLALISAMLAGVAVGHTQKPTAPPSLAQAKSWAYQLRAIDPAEIARSPYDVVVIDFARQGRPLTADEVEVMRTRTDGSRRHIIAYLSLGEAERYRFYWKPEWYLEPPPWLGPENAQWRGNYLVRYWEPAWKGLMFGAPEAYLDRILAAGFDGVYLDRVDAYSEWEKEAPDAQARMIALVTELSAYAKRARPGFHVLIQNAEELLEEASFLRVIDGIGKEDLLHGIDHTDAPNPPDDVTHSVELLRRARKAGKAVFVVEYLCKREDVAKATQRIARELGFVPYVAPRTLHQLGLSESDYCLPVGAQGRRIALVLGNDAYQLVAPLEAPAASAKAVAEALREVGFNEVRLRRDLMRDAFNHELQRFAEAARGADWAVLYYAGLGLELDGVNFALPVNADLARAADVERDGIALEMLERAVEPAANVRLVLVDACRPNPFVKALQQRGLIRAVGVGPAPRAPRRPVVVGYASRCAAPMAIRPGDADPYAAALARHIPTAGLELPWLMERVKDSVLRVTKGEQEPVYVGAFPDATAISPQSAVPPTQIPPTTPAR